MRLILAGLLFVLLIPLAASSAAQEPGEDVKPPPAVESPDREPPSVLPPGGPPRRGPGDPGQRPGPPPAERRFQRGEPGGLQGHLPLQRLMRMIAEQRPELAERLEHLRRQSPERFRRVLAEALMFRLENALNQAERRAGPPPARRPEPGRVPYYEGPAARPHDRVDDSHARVRELEERHEQLETRSHQLAERLRGRRAEGAPPEERERLREELADVVNEQFEVRTELRKVRLEHIERELRELRRMLEKTQRGIQRRERERGAIIERRIDQLLGEDAGGW